MGRYHHVIYKTITNKKRIFGEVGCQAVHNGSFISKFPEILKVKKRVEVRIIIARNTAKDG